MITKTKTLKILLYSLPIPAVLFSLFIGPSQMVTPAAIIDFFFNNSINSNLIKSVIIDVRLPRILLTFITGGALAVSGCSIQAIFRNPLTDPYILGLSSGAAFGAALALAFGFIPVQLSAFIFGLLAVGLSYLMARKNNNVSVVSLILSGIIVSGIFTALLTVIQYFSDPFKLQSIVHWTMGNLHNANWNKLQTSIIPITIGVFVLFIYRWRLNVLALGDDEARTAGINPDKDKLIILLAATLASSSAVAVAGIIGLYGLIVPHMVRMMIGPDNRQSIPLNFLFGGMFLLIIDNFSRTISGFEIPIGVFTMLLGAPFFIFLMKRTNILWNR
ncbi:MAG: iron ABC transporter permease [Bacteroidales bacterium]|nr:iron ABC transporter permease [Bacteroidales bacterium]HOK99774.1 iron ABC transporter permease [Bacteroidales bacterium]HPO66544.1 iron ABC transporter permease [Bacteroidales bacterium]